MRKYYQTNWQKIAFKDFTEMSSSRLADSNFYRSFYREFFRRYRRWDELAPVWLRQKQQVAHFVMGRLPAGKKALSVGCGLGAVEHYLQQARPESDLQVHEVAGESWQWLEREFAPEKCFLGFIPGALPSDARFDLIYLSAVDYALEDQELVSLLAGVRQHLADGGQCLMISASFISRPVTMRQYLVAAARHAKQAILAMLDTVGLRRRGQFWGWMRTAEEYRSIMSRAGYQNICDGLIDPANLTSYWVAGFQYQTSDSSQAFKNANQ